LLAWKEAEILVLFDQWGRGDLSHRKLAHRGSYTERVWVSPSSVDRVMSKAGLRLPGLRRPPRSAKRLCGGLPEPERKALRQEMARLGYRVTAATAKGPLRQHTLAFNKVGGVPGSRGSPRAPARELLARRRQRAPPHRVLARRRCQETGGVEGDPCPFPI